MSEKLLDYLQENYWILRIFLNIKKNEKYRDKIRHNTVDHIKLSSVLPLGQNGNCMSVSAATLAADMQQILD